MTQDAMPGRHSALPAARARYPLFDAGATLMLVILLAGSSLRLLLRRHQ
jgi:hypothetical protein